MANEKKNPVFWCFIAVVLGIILAVWGWNKDQCNSSPDCYKGSGFLIWTGVIFLVSGLLGWALISNSKRRG